ncbi:hypothetical protein [Thermotalea metallivorans]|uniref:Uncharacterized protein n=1 Tax=Thermotalea metallivorans TaxID=520762 RepID=A0A140L2B3_9FIRM|nr:hypothetical protein [Thermotalea metallivorans]KXG74688.1 hypothetical protein AN619_21950 [Thermotalea metallivorans]
MIYMKISQEKKWTVKHFMLKNFFTKRKNEERKEVANKKKDELAEIVYKKKDSKLWKVSDDVIAKAIRDMLRDGKG